ncbi:MAG: glycoside hydrolase family 18 protein [Bacteroidales bacterium]|nr:glycoside hydrolase family 18 protein [Bacteroidales bacterium]
MKKTIILVFLAINIFASAQSTFYRNYSNRKEVARAVCLKNHKIDGIKFDITLIKATDKAAFLKLLSELDLTHTTDNSAMGFLICIRNDENPQIKQPTINNEISLKGACLVGASETELTIYVFHNLKNKDRFKKIINYILIKHRGKS